MSFERSWSESCSLSEALEKQIRTMTDIERGIRGYVRISVDFDGERERTKEAHALIAAVQEGISNLPALRRPLQNA